MAVYDGPDRRESTRAVFTAMSLLTHHPLVGEVVWVDNRPIPEVEVKVNGVTRKVSNLEIFAVKSDGRISYHAFPEPQGTSPPRNHVFKVAKYDRVACIDPHVLLHPGFFESLNDFYDRNPQSADDLLHGPMVTESGQVMATHMNDQWRAEMWGTWGRMWRKPNGNLFSCMDYGEDKIVFCTFGALGEQVATFTPAEFGYDPNMRWSGHEKVLEQVYGCKEVLDRPFPIPGHGMGFFACRKQAWLPFHKDARGFGGEEMTTGVRYRTAGRRCWCIPGAKWWHHFDRPGGVPYRLTTWDKARNYVLEFRRLGLALDPIEQHFAPGRGGSFNAREWNQLLEGAEWPTLPPGEVNPWHANTPQEAQERMAAGNKGLTPVGLSRCPQRASQAKQTAFPRTVETPQGMVPVEEALESLYKDVVSRHPNISSELQLLRQLATGHDYPDGRHARVVELGTGGATWTIALLAGRPQYLLTVDTVKSEAAEAIRKVVPADTIYDHKVYPRVGDQDPEFTIPECDVLVLNGEPEATAVWKLLARFHNRTVRYIVIPGVGKYGEEYDGKGGIYHAVRPFLATFREWVVTARGDNPAGGVLILSRDSRDRPPGPVSIGNSHATTEAPPVQTANPQQPQLISRQVQIVDHGTYDEIVLEDGRRLQIPKAKGFGPGTELKLILKNIGVEERPGCDCNGKMNQMDNWGVKGCREHFDEIVKWMREGMAKWGWYDKMKAAAAAVKTGLALQINWFDPWPDMVNMAIEEAAKKGIQ